MPVKRTPAEYWALVKKHELEITRAEEEYENEEGVITTDPQVINVFPFKDGGVWGQGATLEEAIEDCLRSNNLE